MSNETQTPQAAETVAPARRRTVRPPAVEIIETEDAFLLTADMPGVDEQNADVMLEKEVLTIRGTVQPPELEGYTLIHSEFTPCDYERAFSVSNEIARAGIEATVRDGTLRLTLPKAKEAQTMKIAIKSG